MIKRVKEIAKILTDELGTDVTWEFKQKWNTFHFFVHENVLIKIVSLETINNGGTDGPGAIIN